MSRAISFTVLGIAQPKGSTKAFARMVRLGNGQTVARAGVTSDNTQLKPWEGCIREAVRQQGNGLFFDGPVIVRVDFYLPRPKSLPRKVVFHTKKPDVDKLLRGALDALKGVLWKDDAQVTHATATKAYTGGPACAEFRIEERS